MTSENYTPGGVANALSGHKKPKDKTQNKAVIDLFSQKVPKYDYTAPKQPTVEKKQTTKAGKKRKLEEGKDTPKKEAEKKRRKKKSRDHTETESPKRTRKDVKLKSQTKVTPGPTNSEDPKDKHVHFDGGSEKVAETDSKKDKEKAKKKKKKKVKPKSPAGPEHDSRTLFVGNLPTTCTKKKLLKLFKKFGKIESVRFRSATGADLKLPKKAVIIKQAFHSERQSMNAYVVFAEKTSSDEALALNGTLIEGQCIRVDKTGEERQHDHNKSVFIGNLPFDAKEDAVREHFDECGVITNVRIIRDKKTGLGKGIGYVQFADSPAVGLALKLTGDFFAGRKLRVVRSSNNPQDSSAAPTGKSKQQKKSTTTGGKFSQRTVTGQGKSLRSKSKDQKSENFISFQGSVSNTDKKPKAKLKFKKKLKAKSRDKRKKNLKEIFAGSKDGKSKDNKARHDKKEKMKKSVKDSKPQAHKKIGAKSGKGKIFARNRLSKKLKVKHKGRT